jgi:hypothetical protein
MSDKSEHNNNDVTPKLQPYNFHRGYCVNWNVETDIWSHLFGKKVSISPTVGVHLR